MKIYCSDSDVEEQKLLNGYEFASYQDADDIIILPGGLGCLYDMIRGIQDRKTVYLFNKDYFFTNVLEALYNMHEVGYEKKTPADYMIIESDFSEILKKLEEKKNGKANDGETSKLL